MSRAKLCRNLDINFVECYNLNGIFPTNKAKKEVQMRKRRFGDRRDGRLLRTLPPMNRLSPFIMKNRIGSQNLFRIEVDIAEVERYIHQKRKEGLNNFGILHMLLAGYVRTVSQRPGINRFIAGQKIFARNTIDVIMTIKMEMSLNAEETEIKITFSPDDTAEDIYRKFQEVIERERPSGEKQQESNFEKTARVLNYIPSLILRLVVSFLNFLDYFGWLPKFLTDLSPFHGSLVITSMGSLGIPPVFHHLYDFGNAPIFISYGSKMHVNELQADGSVIKRKKLPLTIVTDERICDGHYYASAIKYLLQTLKHPECLDLSPETIVSDID